MAEVIRVSKAGTNVLTGTAPNQLNYSSEYNTLKYFQSGTVQVIALGTDVEGTVAHNLGYKPFFITLVDNFINLGSITGTYNMVPGRFADAGLYADADSWVDNNKLYVKIEANTGNTGTFAFRYFIFRNNTGL